MAEFMEDSVFDTVESAPAEAQASQENDGVISLSEMLGGSAEEAPLGQAETTEVQQVETSQIDKGYAGRVNAYVDKQLNARLGDFESRFMAMLDQRLAPVRDNVLGQEADALVGSGKIGDKDTALEYLRLKQGVAPQEKPRDEQGRFVSQQAATAATERRAGELMQQHQAILAMGGPDTLELFRTNPKVKEKVASGQWSFIDVAREWKAAQERKHTPTPVRNPNHTVTGRSIEDMSDEELDRISQRAKQGQRIDLRR